MEDYTELRLTRDWVGITMAAVMLAFAAAFSWTAWWLSDWTAVFFYAMALPSGYYGGKMLALSWPRRYRDRHGQPVT